MKVFLIGMNGQLGRSIIKSKPKDVFLYKFSRKELNLLDFNLLEKTIKKNKPDWIINCAAYTNVDFAEIEKNMATKINKDVPKKIAEIISENGGKLLHISTDFVFNGNQNYSYSYKQKRDPINHYGWSKAGGEEAIEKILSKKKQAVILRTSWLISPFGKNFVLTILDLLKGKKNIPVVCDQIGCPTNALLLSKVCWEIIFSDQIFDNNYFEEMAVPIMHWSDLGVTSWYDMALSIEEIAYDLGYLEKKGSIMPIKSKYYKSTATRPKFSLLDCEETYKLLSLKPINWRETIKQILSQVK